MKRNTVRLSLRAETIRALTERDLNLAFGGVDALPLTSIRTNCLDTRCIPPPPPPL